MIGVPCVSSAQTYQQAWPGVRGHEGRYAGVGGAQPRQAVQTGTGQRPIRCGTGLHGRHRIVDDGDARRRPHLPVDHALYGRGRRRSPLAQEAQSATLVRPLDPDLGVHLRTGQFPQQTGCIAQAVGIS